MVRTSLFCGAIAAAGCGSPSSGSPDPFGLPPPVATSDDSGDDPDDDHDGGDGSSSAADDVSESSGGAAGDDEGGGASGYPDIARIQVPASWTIGAGGRWSFEWDGQNPPDYAASRAFYETHGDDYDFLAIYTEGEFDEFYAHAVPVTDDVTGLGLGNQPFSAAAAAGSAGRLQQINLMNTPSLYDWDPSDADILVHETAHRWAAYVELPGTPSQAYVLDESWSHWNIHVHTGGPSATGYGDLVDLGGGSFRFESVWPLQMSPLELYLAGLMPADEVPPMFYVASPGNYDPAVNKWGETLGPKSYGEDATYSGTRVDFTVEDVVAANGVRTPAYGAAPTHFRFAFVMVCADVEHCKEDDLAIVEAQRTAFPATFAAATGDRATVDVAL